MTDWYARSVFFATNVEASLAFYLERLRFDVTWQYEDDGRTTVAQVTRGDCEIILATDPERAGGGRIFISLSRGEVESLRKQIQGDSLEMKEGWWGSPVIEIRDPDANELFFSFDEPSES